MSGLKGWKGAYGGWRDSSWVVRRLAWSVSAVICLATGSCASTAAVRSSTSYDGGEQASIEQGVFLSPAVEAGWAGWCVSVEGTELSGSCADVRSRGPILAERWGRGVGGGGALDVGVTSSEVAAVSLSNGAVMPTHVEPGLPGGLRVVVAKIADDSPATLDGVISHGFTPLNSKREQIRRANDQDRLLGYEVRSEGWNSPATSPHGICAISRTGIGEIRAIRGGVVSEERSYRGLVGDAFVTCADTEYSLNDGKVALLAGMLVNASHPGTTPGALPQMKVLSGHDGIYEAPTEKGEIVARLTAGAWLFVASGPFTKASVDMAQRLTLLEHLRATVHL